MDLQENDMNCLYTASSYKANGILNTVAEIQIPENNHHSLLISGMTDGAATNMGGYNSVLTQLKCDRPWLITTHSVSYMLELALKNYNIFNNIIIIIGFYIVSYST